MIRRALAAALTLAVPFAALAGQDSSKVQTICLAPASVEAAPSGADPVAAVRETFTNFLTGPTLAVTPLTARLQSQVRQEAKLAGCPYLLLTTLKHQRKTGGGLLGRVAGGAVQQGAWAVGGSAGSIGRVAAGAAAGAAYHATYDYATYFKTKDELTLTYRLESAGGSVLVEKTEKRKAMSDGEDLLTPLAQQAAEAIAAQTSKPAGT